LKLRSTRTSQPTVAPRLPREVIERGLARVVREGMASQTMESLTKGVFLVALALHLGASNFVIGLVGAIPFLSNLFQIPAIHIVEKFRNRRKIVAYCCFIGRSFLLLVALAPFLSDKKVALAVVVGGIAMRYSIGAMANCAWNSWMRDLVPKIIMGKFFGRRMFFTTLTASTLGLGAGFFLDWLRGAMPEYAGYGYSVLYVLGFLAGMTSSAMILSIPHPEMPEPEVKAYEKGLTFHYLREPLKNVNFRKLLFFLMSWNFAINLATPFFVVYMFKTLGYDTLFVVAITIMSQVINAFSMRVWGKYTDMYSNKTVLGICGTVFIFCLLGWTFTTFPDPHRFTTPLLIALHVFMGISLSGVSLSTANIAMKLTPSGQATPYLALNSMLSSLAAGIAPLFGGLFADYFEDKTLSLDIHWKASTQDVFINTLEINHWDFFFVLAFIIGLYALRRLALIEEEGAVHEKVVIRELMLDTGRILKSVSSVAGLRDLTMAPMAMMVNLIKRR